MMINEMFLSIQGEGPFTGRLVVFLRTWGCLNFCNFCDTPYTWNPDTKDKECHEMSLDVIEQKLNKLADGKTKTVVITGGEPCMQKELPELVERLVTNDWEIHIETSGKVEIPTMRGTWVICSPKQYDGNFMFDKSIFTKTNFFKFVVENEEEFKNVLQFCEENKIDKERVYLMPKGETRKKQLKTMKFIANECIKYGFNFSGRMHTLIWNTKRKV